MARSQNGAAKSRRKMSSRRPRASRSQSASAVMGDAVAGDVAAMRAEIADMISSLDERINRLNQLTKQGAAHAADGANDIVLNAISDLTGRVTGRAQAGVSSASDEVAKFGTQAVKRFITEVDRRPLLTLAIAAGIGFIAGLARRPE
ncbi:MAG: hypothetical protein AB7V13_19935 [Pseudorhodoplanes sp.]|uniref:hypothetical protein n=1 Tax=Pseudorhodoplanes sp. TaxID=1934341 RepID=UPI003D0AD59D